MENGAKTNLDRLVKEDRIQPPAKPGPTAPHRHQIHPTDHSFIRKADLCWLLGLVVFGVAGSLLIGPRIDPAVFQRQTQDTWFDADVARVVSDMTSRTDSHFRTNVHPLFCLWVYPLTTLVKTTCGISAVSAARIVVALAAGAVLAMVFLVLRLLGCRRFDSVVFALLLATSASTVFWLGVPDTFLLGSVTTLAALCIAAVATRRRVRESWFVIASALTLSFTTTNWMAGIVTTFAYHRWRRALQVTVNAFAVVVILWGVQNVLFEGVNFFFVLRSESQWILPEGLGGWPDIARVFFFDSIVMPEVAVLSTSATPSAWPLLTVQQSPLASGSILGLPATVLWAGLFITGLYAIATHRDKPRFRMVLCLVLAGQLALHLLYGREAFLFAPHYAPLLVLVAAWGTRTRVRRAVLAASIALILCCAYNNAIQFRNANRHIHSFSLSHPTAMTSDTASTPLCSQDHTLFKSGSRRGRMRNSPCGNSGSPSWTTTCSIPGVRPGWVRHSPSRSRGSDRPAPRSRPGRAYRSSH